MAGGAGSGGGALQSGRGLLALEVTAAAACRASDPASGRAWALYFSPSAGAYVLHTFSSTLSSTRVNGSVVNASVHVTDTLSRPTGTRGVDNDTVDGACVAYGDILWGFGGWSHSASALVAPTLTRYSVTTGAFLAPVSAGAGGPPAMARHGMTVDSRTATLYLFGGLKADGSPSTALWAFDVYLGAWRLVSNGATGPERFIPSMSVDVRSAWVVAAPARVGRHGSPCHPRWHPPCAQCRPQPRCRRRHRPAYQLPPSGLLPPHRRRAMTCQRPRHYSRPRVQLGHPM